jgi:hypothetical protein
MNADIEKLVEKCPACAKHATVQKKETLVPADVPPSAWHTLGIDNFELKGQMYLILVDYLTKFPVVRKVRSTSTAETTACMKDIFCDFGIPAKIVCDRGTNFTSEEFTTFANEWNFDVRYTSAEHHQSHGQTERFVQTIKQILKKCSEDGTDYRLALLALKCTPVSAQTGPPTVLLNNRVYKSSLVSLTSLINEQPEHDQIREHLQNRKQKMRDDAGGRDLRELRVGEKVKYYLPRDKIWTDGYIVSKNGRDYKIQSLSGRYITRNRKMIKMCRQESESDNELYEKHPEEKPERGKTTTIQLPVREPQVQTTPLRTTTDVENTPEKIVQVKKRAEQKQKRATTRVTRSKANAPKATKDNPLVVRQTRSGRITDIPGRYKH